MPPRKKPAALTLPALEHGYTVSVERGAATITADKVPAKNVLATVLAMNATLRAANAHADELTPVLDHVGADHLPYEDGPHEADERARRKRLGFTG